MDPSLLKTNLIQNQTPTIKAQAFNSKIYQYVNSSSDLNDSHLAKDRTFNSLHGWDKYGVTGNATLNADDVKKGNKILLGSYTFSNNLNTDMPINVQYSNAEANSEKYGTIGTINFVKENPRTINAILNVTTDQKFTGTVDIHYSNPNMFSLNTPYDIYQFKGSSEANPLIETVSTSNGYSFKVKWNSYIYKEVPFYNSSVVASFMDSPIGAFGFHKTTAFDPASNSGDQNINASQNTSYKTASFHRVIQLTGDNLPKNINGFNGYNTFPYISVFDANGYATDESIPVDSANRSNSIKPLPDNLTPQQIYDQTPTNTAGFSKQKDGSWLVCYNFDNSYGTVSKQDLTDLIDKDSVLANIQDPAHKQQIINNTVKVYEDLLGGQPSIQFIALKINSSNGDTNLVEHDVTPGSTQQINGSGYLSLATGDANGTLQSRISYQFVDDDNNGLAVGQTVTLTGKAGDVVNPHLSVPAGYELAPGQTLPGNYTLKDFNAPVIIHLKHKTGSAVVNTPASQTDEDTSSTPATKANDDSNEQKEQPNNNQQNQSKTNDQDQNKSKNNSDKVVLAGKNNKNISTNDSQKQKLPSANEQLQEAAVKPTKTASQSPTTITQARLPKTDSNDNNSAAMLGATVLTGSFAAMFAMNKHRKED